MNQCVLPNGSVKKVSSTTLPSHSNIMHLKTSYARFFKIYYPDTVFMSAIVFPSSFRWFFVHVRMLFFQIGETWSAVGCTNVSCVACKTCDSGSKLQYKYKCDNVENCRKNSCQLRRQFVTICRKIINKKFRPAAKRICADPILRRKRRLACHLYRIQKKCKIYESRMNLWHAWLRNFFFQLTSVVLRLLKCSVLNLLQRCITCLL